MDRSLLYERYLDDLQLYFTYKGELDEKVKLAYAEGDYHPDVHYWQEFEQLENLRELSRRALDEYISSSPGREREPGE